MKRILLLLALLVPMAARAQLNILSESAPSVTLAKIYTDLNDTRHSLVEVKSGEWGVYLSAATTNRFDDRFIFRLGDTPEEAAHTLRDLAGLCRTHEPGSSLELEMWPGRVCRCSITDRSGRNKGRSALLIFGATGYAGVTMINDNQLRRIAAMVEKHAGL